MGIDIFWRRTYNDTGGIRLISQGGFLVVRRGE
jgi:hypothetical protein